MWLLSGLLLLPAVPGAMKPVRFGNPFLFLVFIFGGGTAFKEKCFAYEGFLGVAGSWWVPAAECSEI